MIKETGNNDRLHSFTTKNLYAQMGTEEKNFTEEDIEIRNKCTYFLYGNKKIKQPQYFCARCDLSQTEAICFDCFFTCHRDCHRTKKKSKKDKGYKQSSKKMEVSKKHGGESDNDDEEEIQNLRGGKRKKLDEHEIKESRFECMCGKKHKHHRKEIQSNENESKITCELMSLVKLPISSKERFFCKECSNSICVLCKFGCHMDHEVVTTNIDSIESYENLVSPDIYESLKQGKCNCQDENHITNEFILGLFFDNAKFAEKYKRLVDSNNTILLNSLFCSEITFLTIKKLLHTVLAKNNIDNKTTLLNFTTKFNKYFTQDNKNYYFNENLSALFPPEQSLAYIENLIDNELDDTTLSFEDNFKIIFNLTNIVYNIHFKKKHQHNMSFTIDDFITSSIVDRLVFKNFYSNPDQELVKCIIKISDMLPKSLATINIFNHFESYANCMNLILYGLKRMIFTKSELETLIVNIHNFYTELHMAYMKNFTKENFDNCYSIFYCFIRIALAITISYNDFVTKEIMDSSLGMKGEVDKMNKFKFLHEHEYYGDKLLKVISKMCLYITMVYRGDVEADETFVHYHNELLKLFCVSDNIYLKQIDGLTISEISYIIKKKVQSNQIESIFDELQKKINDEFNDYFLKVEYLFDDSPNIFFNFNEIMGSITKNIVTNFNNSTNKPKMSHFQKKIFKFAKLYLPIKTENHDSIEVDGIINSLIKSNIKQLLTKYLTNFKYEELHESDINFLFGLMSLFMLNTKGTKYICRGKLIVVVCRLLEKFEFIKDVRRIKFIYILINAIKKYKVNLKEHKIMSSFTKILILLRDNNPVDNLDTKTQRRIVKIFILLKDYFEFDEFQKIKHLILDSFSFVFSKESLQAIKLTSNEETKKDLIKDFLDDKRDEIYRKIIEMNAQDNSDNINNENKVFIHTYNYKLEKPTNSEDKISLIKKDQDPNNSNKGIQLQLNNHVNDHDKVNGSINNKNWENESNSISSQGQVIRNDNNMPKYSIHIFKIFILLLKLQCHNAYYFFEEDQAAIKSIGILNDVLTIDFARGFFNSSGFPLKFRKVLLRLFRTFHFIQKLKETDFADRDQFVTTEEIFNLTNVNSEDQNIIDKKTIVDKMILVLEIFIREFECLDVILYENFTDEYFDELLLGDIKLYIFELLISVKTIAEFLYNEKRIWTKVTWVLYKLARRLLQKSDFIKKILTGINNNNKNFISFFVENRGESVAKTFLKNMQSAEFDFYNKENIYDIVIENIEDILTESGNTKLNRQGVETFLIDYDYKSKMDFTPKGLASTSKIYGNFYTIKKHEDSSIEEEIFLKRLKSEYSETFINIINSSFMRVFKSSTNAKGDIDVKRIVIEYFVNYIASYSGKIVSGVNKTSMYKEGQMISLITLVTKLLYYDTENTQSSLEFLNNKYIDPDAEADEEDNNNNGGEANEDEEDEESDEDDEAGDIFNGFAKTEIKAEDDANNDKDLNPALIIYKKGDICQRFFYNLFNKLQKMFVLNFATVTKSHYFERYIEISNVTKLIIQFLQLLAEGFNSNFHDKMFELKLINGEKIAFFQLIYNQLKTAYSIFNTEKSRVSKNIDMQHNKLISMLTNIVNYLVEYVNGSEDRSKGSQIVTFFQKFVEDKIHKFILCKIHYSDDITKKYELTTSKVYIHIKVKFVELVVSFITKGNVGKETIDWIVKEIPLIEVFEQIMFYVYCLTLKLKEKYHVTSEAIFNVPIERFLYILTTCYINDEEFRDSLELNLSLKIFEYLKIMSDIYDRKQIDNFFEETKEKSYNKEKTQYGEKKVKIKMSSSLSKKVFFFMENLLRKVELKTNDNKKVISFFVKPHYSFFLSKWSRRVFMEKVNRETRFSKLTEFLKEIDFFMYEMLYSSTINFTTSRITKKFEFSNMEIANYFMVIVQQVMLLAHFFKSSNVPERYSHFRDIEKYEIPTENFVFSLFQILYLTLVIIFWFYVQFPLSLRHDLMKLYNTSFLYNKTLKDYSYLKKVSMGDDDSFNAKRLIDQLNKDISFWMKLKVALTDTTLMNKKVNIFFLTLILTVLYLLTKNAIFIVVPVLFVVNLVTILFGIVEAIQQKWKQLLVMLIFTYLCIYFFTWITFYFTYQLFQFDDSYVIDADTQISENHCSTVIQCFLTLIDLGFRSGGGIGDMIPKVSFRENTQFYVIRFFYNITFHIFIILIMGNIFFGIIVDAFSDLRDRNNQIEEDKNNICYICQLGRDKSLNKNINFEDHKEKIHYAWNYVYFITYLFLSNPHDFNAYQHEVWVKINTASDDITWIPGDSDDKEEE